MRRRSARNASMADASANAPTDALADAPMVVGWGAGENQRPPAGHAEFSTHRPPPTVGRRSFSLLARAAMQCGAAKPYCGHNTARKGISGGAALKPWRIDVNFWPA